mgnify:CR=1 FL=1
MRKKHLICAAVNCSIMAVAPGKRAAFYSAEGIACAVTDAVRMGVAAVGNAVMNAGFYHVNICNPKMPCNLLCLFSACPCRRRFHFRRQ